MADRSEQIPLRLTPSEKEDAQEYVNRDDTPYNNMAALFRGAAKREIKDKYDKDAIKDALDELDISFDSDEIVHSMEIALSDVTERIEQFDDRMADMEELLLTSESITELARELYSDMIVVQQAEDLRDIPPAAGLGKTEAAAVAGTVSAWARAIDYDESEVRRALRRAESIYPDVESIITENAEKRYCRVDETVEYDGELKDSVGELREAISSGEYDYEEWGFAADTGDTFTEDEYE